MNHVCAPRPQDEDPARTRLCRPQLRHHSAPRHPANISLATRTTHSPRKPNQTTTTLPIGQSPSATPRRVALRAASYTKYLMLQQLRAAPPRP